MNKILRILAVLASVVLPVAGAAAQGYGAGGNMGGGLMQGNGSMSGQAQRGPGRYMPDPATLPALKDKLAISEQQEPQWKAYSDAASNLWDLRQSMRAAAPGSNATPEERQKIRQSHREAALTAHGETRKARDDLSAVLTPDQRKIFDQEAPPMPTRMPR
ncbi:MAG TPA: Spy/CpxP family protein refolding chaperone [Candidatus Sulfotelmatobacter sp.]|jgi:hypothetical protein|nr:Spy/CpxP family protein refolding chaperone [Candidatus Sulfotelmatobacter sp.]